MRRRALLSSFVASVGLAAAVLFACSSTESTSSPDAGVDAPAPQREASGTDTSIEEVADAAPCMPRPLTTQPKWHPPTALGQNVCVPTQIEGYLDTCLFGTSDAVCDAYRQQNATCAACMYSRQEDAKWGPVVLYETHGYMRTNFPGCAALALGDVSESGCGAAYQLFQECQRLACSTCPLVKDDKTYDERRACETADAVDDICATQLAAYYTKCQTLPKDAAAASPELQRCYNGSSLEDNVRSYLTFWCAASPTDAGNDADAN